MALFLSLRNPARDILPDEVIPPEIMHLLEDYFRSRNRLTRSHEGLNEFLRDVRTRRLWVARIEGQTCDFATPVSTPPHHHLRVFQTSWALGQVSFGESVLLPVRPGAIFRICGREEPAQPAMASAVPGKRRRWSRRGMPALATALRNAAYYGGGEVCSAVRLDHRAAAAMSHFRLGPTIPAAPLSFALRDPSQLDEIGDAMRSGQFSNVRPHALIFAICEHASEDSFEIGGHVYHPQLGVLGSAFQRRTPGPYFVAAVVMGSSTRPNEVVLQSAYAIPYDSRYNVPVDSENERIALARVHAAVAELGIRNVEISKPLFARHNVMTDIVLHSARCSLPLFIEVAGSNDDIYLARKIHQHGQLRNAGLAYTHIARFHSDLARRVASNAMCVDIESWHRAFGSLRALRRPPETT